MKQFIIFVGLPGSGKSFYSKMLQAEYPGSIILSRDNLRVNDKGMYVYNPATEGQVHIDFLKRVEAAYNDKKINTIIIDDANLRLEEIITLLLTIDNPSNQIVIIGMEPGPLHLHYERDKLNGHNVPIDKMIQFKEMYKTLMEVLKKSMCVIEVPYPLGLFKDITKNIFTKDDIQLVNSMQSMIMKSLLPKIKYAFLTYQGEFHLFKRMLPKDIQKEIVKGYCSKTRIVPALTFNEKPFNYDIQNENDGLELPLNFLDFMFEPNEDEKLN